MLEKLKRQAIDNATAASVEEALQLDMAYSTAQLCAAADEIRLKWCGSKIHTCSIVNARSGRCPEDCRWCAQSGRHHTGIREYEYIGREEMMAAFDKNRSLGASCFSMVTSGRKVSPSHMAHFCSLFKEASDKGRIGLCASMGLLGREQLLQLWNAGVRKYHCNLETSASYFPKVCTTHSIEDKLATLRIAREIGFTICCGGIIGMGETMRDRLELAEMARDAGASSIPINILSPVKGTPLQDVEPLSEEEIARSVALMRFVAPRCTLHFAGGRARISKESTRRILRGGMNGALIGDMLTTVGNDVDEDLSLFKETGYHI